MILYQLYAFVLPAFTPEEKKVALPLLLMVPVLFIAGVVFGYFVVLPAALDFLLDFNADEFQNEVRARDYYSFVAMTLIVDRRPVPDPGRRAGADQARHHDAARSCARTAATRSSSSRCSPRSCPASIR